MRTSDREHVCCALDVMCRKVIKEGIQMKQSNLLFIHCRAYSFYISHERCGWEGEDYHSITYYTSKWKKCIRWE